jgi:hypothetical protein
LASRTRTLRRYRAFAKRKPHHEYDAISSRHPEPNIEPARRFGGVRSPCEFFESPANRRDFAGPHHSSIAAGDRRLDESPARLDNGIDADLVSLSAER